LIGLSNPIASAPLCALVSSAAVDSARSWVVDKDRCNDDDCTANRAAGRAGNLGDAAGGDRGGDCICISGDPVAGECT
jgi:hypothetical protein